MRFGILLPHFGPHATSSSLLGLARRLERLGFQSVWVRDSVGFAGGRRWEPQSRFFLDPLLTLSTIAGETSVTVGTAVLIPFRGPLVTALQVATLAHLAHGRLILGLGLGGSPGVGGLLGATFKEREAQLTETVEVIRRLARPRASFEGRYVAFRDLTIAPAPPADLELWFGGTTASAVDRAVHHRGGWLPGTCPLRVFDRSLRRYHAGTAAAQVQPVVGAVPVISIAANHEQAIARCDLSGMLAEANLRRSWRVAGPFQTEADLAGYLIAGSPEEVIAGLREFERRSVSELVLDLRVSTNFETSVELLAERVLPAFASDRSPRDLR